MGGESIVEIHHFSLVIVIHYNIRNLSGEKYVGENAFQHL